MNIDEVQEHLGSIACHVDENDIALICKYASMVLPDEIMVDLGTAFGKSCGAMALVNPQAKVRTVDIENSPLKLDPIPKNLFFLRGNSQTFPFEDEIAMMNIDADHTYEGVKADLEHWMPFVKPGGYVILHDYLMPEFGVKQAVDELIAQGGFKFIETSGISCVIQKDMAYRIKDITGIILNWRTARMTRGAVMNMKKWYPGLKEILIGDDASHDTHGDYNRAYSRDAYFKEDKLDMDTDKLKGINGTRFFQFENHQGHGLTLDRIIKYVTTPLMLTMDSDMRIVDSGLVEEYLEKYNQDPENIYAVGTSLMEGFEYWKDNARQSFHFSWVDPFFTLWNMEPLRRYERFGFTNFILPGYHLGTAAFLSYQLENLDNCHADRLPYHAIKYPEPDHIKQLWHLRRFHEDPPDSERAIKWEQLMDG